MRLDGLVEHEAREALLGAIAERLPLLGRVDPAKADPVLHILAVEHL
jgi:hypothetical protein